MARRLEEQYDDTFGRNVKQFRLGASVIPTTSPAPPSSSLPRTQASSPEPNSSSTADKPRS